MTMDLHQPYPGVVLLQTRWGTVLFGAPADAFKATKRYCNEHGLSFPRVLVAPQRLLAEAMPQFNPEFFLYDFLFVYGAAFKPELAHERLQVVVDTNQQKGLFAALRMTLTGPSREEMMAYAGPSRTPLMPAEHVRLLADVSEHMAIRKGDRPRELDEMIATVLLDKNGRAKVFDDKLEIERTGPATFVVRAGGAEERIDVSFTSPVIPFAVPPAPLAPQTPMAFGIKTLGTRNGFDLSGPTTGFLIWVNGRAIVYDGPVGTSYILERQGITKDDIDAIILSHCHEDHMGAFSELILAGRRPKVLTSEPIYRSALTKLACYFQKPESEVARYIDYQRVTPGDPIEVLGAQFNFFYTVHSIPTVGVEITHSQGGVERSVQISGDTMHHDGLDKMHAEGVIGDSAYADMRALIPDGKKDGSLYFADVGEAIIHGHPKDWADNPNAVQYYHCSDNDSTRSHGHPVSAPGESHELAPARKLHPLAPARLLNALRFLEIDDPAWLTNILFRGFSHSAEAGEVLVKHGQSKLGSNSFTVIVSGTATVKSRRGSHVATLRPGEYFGAIDLMSSSSRHSATITAETPMELFDIDGRLFQEYILEKGLEGAIQKMWKLRPMIDSVRIFSRLDLGTRDRLARIAVEEHYAKGEVIVTQGSQRDDFFLLTHGTVDRVVDGEVVSELVGGNPDSYFGEIVVVEPFRPHGATARARGSVTVLRIPGAKARTILERRAGVFYGLELKLKERSPHVAD